MFIDRNLIVDDGISSDATFSSSVAGRFHELTQNHIHATARVLRSEALALQKTPSGLLNDTLDPDERLLLSQLDFPDPTATLHHSRQITDLAIAQVMDWKCSLVEKAAYVGALVEREWWELPDPKGGMIQNVALSRASGRYFTPPDIAWHIVVSALGPNLDSAISSADLEKIAQASRMTVLDPACGAGIFLVCALEVFAAFFDFSVKRYPELAQHFGPKDNFLARVIEEQLNGVEISQRVFDVTTTFLKNALSGRSASPSGIRVGDGLELSPTTEQNQKRYDVVLLNPPFGRLRFQQSEISLKSRAFRAEAKADKGLVTRKKAQVAQVAEVVRKLDRFRVAKGGVLDWQRLFLAQAIHKTKVGGRIGAILPVSLMADRSAVTMREHLLEHSQIERVDLFSETAKLFPGVNQPTCIIVMSTSNRSEPFPVRGPVRAVSDLGRNATFIDLPLIKTVSRTNIPIISLSSRDIELLECLKSFKRIGDHRKIANRRGEIDVTLLKDLLQQTGMPLVRGGDIERFRSKSQMERGRLEAVDYSHLERRLKGSSKLEDARTYRVAGRQCSFMEKPRRMSFAVVPPFTTLANSCNYLLWIGGAERIQHGLCGILNSSLFEWRFRVASSNNHVNNYELDDLPMPDEISDELTELSTLLGRVNESLPFGESAVPVSLIEAQLDALVFKQFGITAPQADHILCSIKAVHRAETLRLMN
ncbi:N-6 DNA methylase [Agrobacterium deltaense]|uniref:N-6 DNA methylase n=1 Tax=Agrobacterium deltaense TaxID=1183412 RepID=UPI003D993C21